MRDLDVVAVGEILLDLVAPDATTLAGAQSFLPAPGGAPGNLAVAVARLGGRSAFTGAVGRDAFGDLLAGVLRENGVDISALRVVPQRTTLAFVARDSGPIPDFLFYRGADAVLTPEDIPLDLLQRASFLYVTSMPLLSQPSRDATLTAMRLAGEVNAVVAVDPNLRPSSWPSLEEAREGIAPLIAGAGVLKVNAEEAAHLTGRRDPGAALSALSTGTALTVVTLGEDGCIWSWGAETGHVPSPPARVVDTIGAGDAFFGALLAELSARGNGADRFGDLTAADLTASLSFACAAASLACERPGAMSSLPKRAEVERRLGG
jgi:fructokinase